MSISLQRSPRFDVDTAENGLPKRYILSKCLFPMSNRPDDVFEQRSDHAVRLMIQLAFTTIRAPLPLAVFGYCVGARVFDEEDEVRHLSLTSCAR